VSATPNVYELIANCTAELAKTGIAKDSRNAQQGYAFRGIDSVFNALAPVLAKQKLVIIPRILSRSAVERTTQKGGVLFYVTVEAEFDFVSALDGSKHTARTFGEAMDSGDKATNKAMSAAYKYAAFQTFCIPTEGDNDADATTHEVVAVISDDQRTELVDIANEHGWPLDDIKKLLKTHGVDSSKFLPVTKYDAVKAALMARPLPAGAPA
jgi:hypothetical protein